MVKLGVLALQGDHAAHAAALRRAATAAGIAAEVALVRTPGQLAGLSALVLPGGESTTLLKLLAEGGLDEAIVRFARSGGIVFGTCAGAILLARAVTNPVQRSLGLLDAAIERNAYGRQVDSFVGEARLLPAAAGILGTAALPAVFIRAPRLLSVGTGVEVLAVEGDDPVLVREGNVIAATFHPELADDVRVHRFVVEAAAGREATGTARGAAGGRSAGAATA